MPDLALELSNLELADRHIEEARRQVAAASARVQEREQAGEDADESRQTLRTLAESLAAFEAHRAVIVQTIEDTRAGRL
ncbi:MAG TPA: hypothetical protein VHM00_11685 [Caldimonas sp.]|jgi:hypothetical protein|nr:hypothetical protein [Caldimonas sp.]HEX2541730.1 hypothetical protein [Caldimonas sp.]